MKLKFPWPQRALLFCLCELLTFQIWRPVFALKSGFTYRIEAGIRDCFYEHVQKNITLDVEYQVIEGGDLDISFSLKLPSGEIVIKDNQKTDESHSITTKEEGVYEFCFDNTFSSLASKTVFADLGVDFSNGDDDDRVKGLKDSLDDKEMDSFTNALDNIKTSLEKAEHYQNFLRSAESRDYKLVKSNNNRVFWWSLIQSIALVGVAFVQVTIVKQFFGGGKYTARV